MDVPTARSLLRTREELLDRDVSTSELRAAGTGGRWMRMQPGVYVDRATFDALRPTARHHVAVVAAVGRARGRVGVVSHLSAAVLHGLPQYRFRARPVSLTVPDATHPPSRAGLRRHTDALDESDVVEVGASGARRSSARSSMSREANPSRPPSRAPMPHCVAMWSPGEHSTRTRRPSGRTACAVAPNERQGDAVCVARAGWGSSRTDAPSRPGRA